MYKATSACLRCTFNSSVSKKCVRHYSFKEGDIVLLEKVGANQTRILSKPLRSSRQTPVHNGTVAHTDILGSHSRDKVVSSHGKEYRLLTPSLEDYVTLTPRYVTPIYPAYANDIVAKLDLHCCPPADSSDSPDKLEILEAGTGHGGLTLYLARAIHAANIPPPSSVEEIGNIEEDAEIQTTNPDDRDKWALSGPYGLPAPYPSEWRASRAAVIHSVDISPMNSLRARKTVRNFRRGIYAGNVDFYIGKVQDWISQELNKRFGESLPAKTPFINHIILDLPDCQHMLEDAASVLLRDGKLFVFCPSITQIVACVEAIKRDKLPLLLESVLELGPGTSGGREWDVRAYHPKSTTISSNRPENGEKNADTSDVDLGDFSASSGEAKDWVTVCRPKVGTRTVNGAFLGVWQKMQT